MKIQGTHSVWLGERSAEHFFGLSSMFEGAEGGSVGKGAYHQAW